MLAGAIYRPASQGDRAFVWTSWLRSFSGSPYAGPIPMGAYWKAYERALLEVLGRSTVTVTVAANESDPGQIFGFAVTEAGCALPTLHYVYTKQAFRRLGVARSLLSASGLSGPAFFTFRTPAGDAFLLSVLGSVREVAPQDRDRRQHVAERMESGAWFDPMLVRRRERAEERRAA